MLERRDVPLEISLWHNGKPKTPTAIIYNVMIGPNGESLQSLHTNNHEAFQVRLRWNTEIVDNWIGAEMWLTDGDGYPIGGAKPTLVYLGVSDCPMTTAFLCHIGEGRPSMVGVWVVAIRHARTIQSLAETTRPPV